MSRKRLGAPLLAAGILTGLVLVYLGYEARTSARPNLALIVVLAIFTVGFIAAGVGALRSGAHPDALSGEPGDYRHAYRLFGIVGALLLATLAARSYAVPASFGQFGHYRGTAPKDAQKVRAPQHQGRKSCVKCHELQAEDHAKDAHHTVECENCHGPAPEHVLVDATKKNIEKRVTKEWCLVCHRKLNARPGAFPQVSWRDHYKFVGVKDESIECIKCHDPHRPLFLEKPITEARLHPLVHRCRDCHIGEMDEKKALPKEHPATFECSYCHEKLTKHAAESSHPDVRCTTCHLFIKDSDYAGRIVRNTDPRFCLLCHAKTDFRSSKAKGIDWPGHLEQVKADTKDEETPCTKCHGLHDTDPAKKTAAGKEKP